MYEGTLTAEQWREFGSGIARMHLQMDAFSTSHDRYHLDERILVERPLASLAPYASSGRAAAELGTLGERLTSELQRLRAIRGAYGIIHADLHRGNTNIDGDPAWPANRRAVLARATPHGLRVRWEPRQMPY